MILQNAKHPMLDNIKHRHAHFIVLPWQLNLTHHYSLSQCMKCTHTSTHFWQRWGKLGQIPQVARLWPLSACRAIFCNNKSKSFKARPLRRRKIGRKDGESREEREREGGSSDSSLKMLRTASLISFLDAWVRLHSWLSEPLNSQPIEQSHSGSSNWAFFSLLHVCLTLLFYLSSFPSQ